MIKGDVTKLIDWLKINNIQYWTLSTAANVQSNTKLFESDPDKRIEDEYDRMASVLSLSENTLIYVTGKKNKATTTGNFQETFCNKPEFAAAATQAPAKMGALEAGAMGYVPIEEVERRINEALDKRDFERQKEDFERERKEFRQEKKEFDNFKNGAIGMLLDKAMPYLGGLVGRSKLPAVAGVPGSIEANKIVPANPYQEEPDDTDNAPSDNTPGTTGEGAESASAMAQEEEAFTDEESDKLYELMATYKNFDPEYLQVIEKIVKIATSGEPVTIMGAMKMEYAQLKEMLLKL